VNRFRTATTQAGRYSSHPTVRVQRRCGTA